MINWTKAEELRDDIGEEGFGEIIEVFLEEVEEALAVLESQQKSELGKAMHFLKGSALNLGFDQFASECQSGEDLANRGQEEQIDLQHLQATYIASKAAFMAHFEKQT